MTTKESSELVKLAKRYGFLVISENADFRRRVRSELYFAIFDELAKAGIEIPFPQRDIHVRSMVGGQTSPE